MKEVIEIATAASPKDSAKRLATLNSGLVRCHDAVIKKASSIPIPKKNFLIKVLFK